MHNLLLEKDYQGAILGYLFQPNETLLNLMYVTKSD